MEVIQEMCDFIKDEIEGAENYIKFADKYRNEYRELADYIYNLSLEEVKHMQGLHAHVVELINNYRKEHGEPPAEMKWRYDYLHAIHMDDAAKVKARQILYKEQ